MNEIGFIQGRLVDQIDNKIQAFPKKEWVLELDIASKNELNFIELTVDYDDILDNPIATMSGCQRLKKKLQEHMIKPIACTADFVMQNPPWKNSMSEMIEITKKIINGMGLVGCKVLVIPFVDNSSLKYEDEENAIKYLLSLRETLQRCKVRIAIESDYNPKKLIEFIKKLPEKFFGINYDIGNSASLGYDYKEELNTYFHRIIHVHVKDRKYRGDTVPLGEGDAKLIEVLKLMKDLEYKNNFSMQTARDNSGNHLKAMLKYMSFVNKVLSE